MDVLIAATPMDYEETLLATSLGSPHSHRHSPDGDHISGQLKACRHRRPGS
jgi:hypothetical protein